MDYTKTFLGLLLLVVSISHFSTAVSSNCTAAEDCESCLNMSSCFWCPDEKCSAQHGLLPTGCKLNWRYYGYCKIPGYVWVAVIPGICFLVLLGIILTVCCCCCNCRWSKKSLDKEETKFHRKRMELKAKHEERRAERKLKTDEIRKKYGLYKGDDGDGSTSQRYERFQNDPEV